jgi:hypothetical protein
MEPPIGYGIGVSFHFPESHFRTTPGWISAVWGHGSLRELGSASPARSPQGVGDSLGSTIRVSIIIAASFPSTTVISAVALPAAVARNRSDQ